LWLRHRRARCILLASLGIVPNRAPRRLPLRCLDVLREDNSAIIRAPSQASKAADYNPRISPGGPAQAAGAVVSFALPWNPSKVEQCASWARNRRHLEIRACPRAGRVPLSWM